MPDFISNFFTAKGILYFYFLLFIIFNILTIYFVRRETTEKNKNSDSGNNKKKKKEDKIIRSITTTFLFILISGVYYLYLYFFSCDDEKSTRNEYVTYLFVFVSTIVLLYGIDILSIMRNNKFSVLIGSLLTSAFFMYTSNYYDWMSTKRSLMYSLQFIFFMFLFSYNPYNVAPKLSAVNIMIIAFTILFFVLMIFWYDVNPLSEPNDLYTWLKNTGLILISIGVSVGVILGIFASFGVFKKQNPGTGKYILNIMIIIGLLSILYNLIDKSGLLKKYPIFDLIVNIVLYIPCLLNDLLEILMKEYYQTKYSTIILVAIEIVLILIYKFYPTIISWLYTRDGKLLINKPVSLNRERIIGYYEELSGTNQVEAEKIKDQSKMRVGDSVQVKQPLSEKNDYPFMNGATIMNIRDFNTYDIKHEDKTVSYNVPKKWLKQMKDKTTDKDKPTDKDKTTDKDRSSDYKIGDTVRSKKVWLIGTISKINPDQSYNVKYKIEDDNQEEEEDKSSNIFSRVSRLFDTDKNTDANIDAGRIQLINVIKPNYNAYRFSISFWVFINSTAPNQNQNYNKYTSILNYTGVPNVMYNPSKNQLAVTVVQNKKSPTGVSRNDINNDVNNDFKIIYTKNNILLQKWHQIIINYDAGTLDTFFNGELVNSTSAVVPNIKHHELKIGTKDGISAGICNVVYYNHPLDIITINNLYSLTKKNGTPNVPEPDLFSYNI